MSGDSAVSNGGAELKGTRTSPGHMQLGVLNLYNRAQGIWSVDWTLGKNQACFFGKPCLCKWSIQIQGMKKF